ncbi:MAG: histidine phosphatase family protein [Rhodocyclaceae bacterium]|nr:histidine phosphatase family protein [Rhodocyclaceae bacterium]
MWLIRHPPPAVERGICYGATDLPLAADPFWLAQALKAYVPADLPIYTSPLRRCLDFAHALTPHPRVDERLRELDFGAWEMRRWDELERHLLAEWARDPWGFTPPGGEPLRALRERVVAFLAQLPQEAVLVTHAGVMKACCAEIAGFGDWFAYSFDYGQLTLVERGRVRANIAP